MTACEDAARRYAEEICALKRERDEARERIEALDAKCALFAASLNLAEKERDSALAREKGLRNLVLGALLKLRSDYHHEAETTKDGGAAARFCAKADAFDQAMDAVRAALGEREGE